MPKLKITQVRSTNRRPKKQRQTMAALGLRRIRQTVVREDTPVMRGMIGKVSHLVEVEELDEDVAAEEEAAA
jgi:large subunit ribosomal protein L30